MNNPTPALLNPGATEAEVLSEMAVVLTMVDDHFCMDRDSELAQTLRALVNTCCTLGNQ